MDAPIPLRPLILSPLHLNVPPFGETSFEDLFQHYLNAMLGQICDAVLLRDAGNLAEARAAALAADKLGLPFAAAFLCDEEGLTPAGTDTLAACIVMDGMGCQAFGLCCPENIAQVQLARMASYANVPLFWLDETGRHSFSYLPVPRDPDVIPCSSGTHPVFITPDVDVGKTIECSPDLLADILDAEDQPVGALKIAILETDDLDIFAAHQYAVQDALCLWSDVPELLEAALRLYQGRAFYDGTGDLPADFLAGMSRKYGLVVL